MKMRLKPQSLWRGGSARIPFQGAGLAKSRREGTWQVPLLVARSFTAHLFAGIRPFLAPMGL